jgi:TnpA family transposase
MRHQGYDSEDSIDTWTLTPEDHALVAGKSRVNRLGFAVLLLFFRANGRFPEASEIHPSIVARVAEQLGTNNGPILDQAWHSRTGKRHRAEIRVLFGFREPTVADAEEMAAWLRDHAVAHSRDPDYLAGALKAHCRSSSIEPPRPERIDRIVRAAARAYEDRFCETIRDRMMPVTHARLEALLQPVGSEIEAEGMVELSSSARAVINLLRDDPGRASVKSLRQEMAKLDLIRQLDLPPDLFDHTSIQELERYRQRVAVEASFELRRHPEPMRVTWLAAFAYVRGRAITDGLVDLLIETIHHIGARAERKVERELLEDLKRVSGKQNLLFELADAALTNPDGIVREVVYPVVGEQTLRDLVKEWKATGPTYRTTLRTVIRNSYSGHYRQMVPQLLETLSFRSNNEVHQPVICALEIVKRYAGTKLRIFPIEETVPLEGVVRGLWREAVVETDAQGRSRVNRITYEICLLEALREQLRCKEIWVVGANRYRNPDEDLPTDFEALRTPYYEALNLPLEANRFVLGLQEEMRKALQTLDSGLARNPDVRISDKAGGWIAVTPLTAQPEPANLAALKAEIAEAWPMTSLLDMLKETDLRLNFTDTLRSPTAYENLDRAILRPRLLLCLHGIGTNAGLQRMNAAQHGATYKDLVYVRRRYLTVDRLRRAITIVTNGTLNARNPGIWGQGTTACASDSKHFGAWDQNLTTQWHVRYGGRGIMIYWHVERKSLCIHSQLKSPSSSEVAAMIEGVIRHCTEMSIDRQYVDSHGQSEVAFAFCHLLGFQLLPRLKAIHLQRLYRPESGRPEAYEHLQPVLTRPIDWDLIRQQYDQMIKYTTALRLGTAETEAILRRFTRTNVQHPTYKALAELGKVIKTIFLCRYLHDENLRREIHEGLNVIEQWNGANDFVFFARRGELVSNRTEDHELSMLALHLLQNCMVYINTLMMQQVLARPHWAGRLTPTDLRAVTPLIWEHVNPYGRFELDMETRLDLSPNGPW